MRNIPIITKNLLIINVIVYLVQLLTGNGPYIDDVSFYCGLFYIGNDHFHLWQPLTYMFLHGSFMHLFFNMFALWMFGCTIERAFGSKRFLIYYLCCGIGAGLFQEAVQFMTIPAHLANSVGPTVGASGAIYGILLAFGMIFPEERIFIFPIPFPIKAKWLVILYAGIELLMAMGNTGDGVAHLAHLGGMVVGFLLIVYWRRQQRFRARSTMGQQFFNRMKDAVDRYKKDTTLKAHTTRYDASATRHETDEEYNARKKAIQDEIDVILDKIRKSGYDSLTKEEKKRLFELSNKQ